MGLIQDALRRWREKKEFAKNYETEQRTIEGYETRKMDSDERELLRFMEEARKKKIKFQLGKFRRRMQDKIWRGKDGNPAYAPNVVKGQKELYKGQKNIFTQKSTLFKHPDLFFKK